MEFLYEYFVPYGAMTVTTAFTSMFLSEGLRIILQALRNRHFRPCITYIWENTTCWLWGVIVIGFLIDPADFLVVLLSVTVYLISVDSAVKMHQSYNRVPKYEGNLLAEGLCTHIKKFVLGEKGTKALSEHIEKEFPVIGGEQHSFMESEPQPLIIIPDFSNVEHFPEDCLFDPTSGISLLSGLVRLEQQKDTRARVVWAKPVKYKADVGCDKGREKNCTVLRLRMDSRIDNGADDFYHFRVIDLRALEHLRMKYVCKAAQTKQYRLARHELCERVRSFKEGLDEVLKRENLIDEVYVIDVPGKSWDRFLGGTWTVDSYLDK